MRCKKGDIAVIVRADTDPECLGRIVCVVALRVAMGNIAWQVDPPHFWTCENGMRLEVMWDDRDLLPIRDQPGEDEMLRIAGLPNKQPEVA